MCIRLIIKWRLFAVLLLSTTSLANNANAESFSDTLIVLQADGRSYVAQQTLVSNGDTLTQSLPAGRRELETRFSGPDRLKFIEAYKQSPDQLYLNSGSVLTRFRHRYTTGLQKTGKDTYTLNASTEHASVKTQGPDSMQWSVSWILPSNVKLLNFKNLSPTTHNPSQAVANKQPSSNVIPSSTDKSDDTNGEWQTNGQMITYQQVGGILPELIITFALNAITQGAESSDALAEADAVAEKTIELAEESASAIGKPSSSLANALAAGATASQNLPTESAPLKSLKSAADSLATTPPVSSPSSQAIPAVMATEPEKAGTSTPEAACIPGQTSLETCSQDLDNDGVPDYRDICLLPNQEDFLTQALNAQTGNPDDNTGPTSITEAPDPSSQNDPLGCANQALITLPGVRFEREQSYLDVTARKVLNRVAFALQQAPETRLEIGAHTDNAGRVSHNQRLSQKRAQEIKYYLRLRGIDASQLRAQGYGETTPAYDNTEAAGRRANRRIELRRLN